ATAAAHAAINYAIRARAQELAGERLRGPIMIRVIKLGERRIATPDIVELGGEVGEIFAHLEPRLEHADLRKLGRAVEDRLGLCRSKVERGVPGAPAALVEAAATRARMAECRHDHARLRPTHDPLV